MPTASESWPERVMNRLRSSADDGLDVLSFNTRRILLSVLLGLLAGLLLGLFLGWVVWPVQWSNTRPTHLEPDAKAQFIAAVADAYIATGGDPTELETARMRLIGMDEVDFADARAYFANTIPGSAMVQDPTLEEASVYRQYAEQWALSFDSNIRLNNIDRLAVDLGVPLDVATTSAVSSIAQSVEQPAVDAQPADSAAQTVEETNNQSTDLTAPSSSTGTGGLFVGGLGRAVACLTALMLVLGGVYILVRLDQRMNWLKMAIDRVRGGDLPSTERSYRRGAYEQDELGRDSSRIAKGGAATFEDEYRFDRDGSPIDPEKVQADTEFDADGFDDDDGYDDFERGSYSYGASNTQEREFVAQEDHDDFPERHTDVGPAALSAPPRSSIPSSVPPQPRRNDFTDGQSDEDYDYRNVPDMDVEMYGQRADRPQSSPVFDTLDSTDYVEPPQFDDSPWPASASSSLSQYSGERIGADDSDDIIRRPVSGASTGRSPARTRRKVLEHTARYQRGQRAEYEENQHIFIDGNGVDNLGRNVGECGLGVNFKNGILLNNPHDVIALDVWLLDKVKAEMLTSVKRILISEYVIERKLEDVIQREIHSDGEPLVPQPGLEFELQGANLSLTCRILEASYVQDGEQAGVFNTLALEMTVYANV